VDEPPFSQHQAHHPSVRHPLACAHRGRRLHVLSCPYQGCPIAETGHLAAREYIEERRKGRNSVLVHCQQASCVSLISLLLKCCTLQGVSRSASIVIAYFIPYHHMTYDEAFKFKCVNQNAGFVGCLREWQEKWGVPASLELHDSETADQHMRGGVGVQRDEER
jgi:hypothetical protein